MKVWNFKYSFFFHRLLAEGGFFFFFIKVNRRVWVSAFLCVCLSTRTLWHWVTLILSSPMPDSMISCWKSLSLSLSFSLSLLVQPSSRKATYYFTSAGPTRVFCLPMYTNSRLHVNTEQWNNAEWVAWLIWFTNVQQNACLCIRNWMCLQLHCLKCFFCWYLYVWDWWGVGGTSVFVNDKWVCSFEVCNR